MKRQLPSQLLESQFLDPATRNTPLSETIRLGAQLMLQKAIELEVTEYLGRDHYQRHGEGLLRGYQDILYLFCDGIYLRLRREDKQAVAVLCAYGMKADGRKVLLHLAVGDKESTVCWKSFFEDMKRRGLKEPLLLVIDGNSGLRKAVRECFPDSWVQRCQDAGASDAEHSVQAAGERPAGIKETHPESLHGAELQDGSCRSPSRRGDVPGAAPGGDEVPGDRLGGVSDGTAIPGTSPKAYPHHKPVGASVRRGSASGKSHPLLMNEKSGLSLMFAVLVDASAAWRGLKITAAVSCQLEALRKNSTSNGVLPIAA